MIEVALKNDIQWSESVALWAMRAFLDASGHFIVVIDFNARVVCQERNTDTTRKWLQQPNDDEEPVVSVFCERNLKP